MGRSGMIASASLRFICLDPRKDKRATIAATLSRLGTVEWRRFGPLALRSWPQTSVVAARALETARGGGRHRLRDRLSSVLYAMQYNGARALFAKSPDSVAVCWNGLNGSRRAFMQGAADAGARTLFYELAPVPGRITVDPAGVNFASALPREIGPYIAWFDRQARDADDWRAAGRDIRQRGPVGRDAGCNADTKRDGTAPAARPTASRQTAATLPAATLPDTPFVFVPLQTPGDSQLRLFGGAFRTPEAFIDVLGRVADDLPEGWHLRIKEHPTAQVSYAERIGALNPDRVVLDNATDTFEQVAAARAVLTVNSSVGLQAMFYDRPVLVAGQCFWAVDGVADSVPTEEAIRAALGRAAELTFDSAARAAFMSALVQVYYPRAAPDAAEQILARLGGPDPSGFWACAAVRR